MFLYGPRPTNTLLSRSLAAPRQTFNVSTASVPHGTRRQLETTTSTGNNVPLSTLEVNQDGFLANEPNPKRQKLDGGHNSQNTPQILDGSEDEDQLMIDKITSFRYVPPRLNNDVTPVSTTSLPGEKGCKQIPPKPAPNIGVQEYKAVEGMMNSKVPRRKKPLHGQNQDASLTPRSSFGSSMSEHVDILGIDDPQNPVVSTKYKGTVNLHPPRTSQANFSSFFGHSTGKRSRHFTSIVNSKAPPPKASSKEVNRTEARLTDQFRDTNGKPRGGTASISSDEIATAEPNSRALSPVKSARAQSPVDVSHSIAPIAVDDDESQDLKPIQSNIRPSIFTKTAKNGTHIESYTRRDNGLQESPAPWNIPLKAYNFQGKRHADDSLALVFNNKTGCYDIHHNGRNLAKDYPALRANPAKIQKISWAMDGTTMRLSSSRVGIHDNELDIEMNTERDVVKLNTELQESGNSMNVKGESRYAIPLVYKLWVISFTEFSNRKRMESMFEHRLKEQQKALTSGRVSATVLPDDLDLARRRLELADQKRASMEQQKINSKQSRLIDKFKPEPERSNSSQPRQGQNLTAAVTAKNRNVANETQFKGSNEDFTRLSDGDFKYSLRSQKDRGAPSKYTYEALPDESKPEVEKYSIVHGLGRPWCKPLVYPKEGKKRTTVEWIDLQRLDEGEFLNDNLIAFYLRYLEVTAEQADPTTSKKVYMFNTFFYNSLTTTETGSKGFNYDAVKRWTRNVDLFTYDFVVVPVNESVHWYIAIIGNLPEMRRILDDQADELGPDFALPSEDGQEQHTRNSDIFSSSPHRELGGKTPREATPQANGDHTDTKEQETAASFAEMSLEANGDPINGQEPSQELPGALQSDLADQEMLDGQLQSPVVKPDRQQILNVDGPQETVEEDSEIVQTGRVSPSQLKKGKRKTQPPPRVFDPYKPTILTFDSLGTPHANAIRFLKQYLQEEAKAKRGNMAFDAKTLRGVTAKRIPEQDNFCDCGLFLLGYMEKFFENPRDFIDNVMRQAWDIKTDWPKLDPSKMRARMRDLLMDLNRERLQEGKKARDAKLASNPLKAQNANPLQDESKDKPLDTTTTKDTVNKEEVNDQPAGIFAEAPQQISPALASDQYAGDRAEKADNAMAFEQSPDVFDLTLRKVLGDITPAVAPHASPSPTPLRDTAQSFIVPDSQPQPSAESEPSPNPPHSHPEPEPSTLSSEFPSTIQDSQPPTNSGSFEEQTLPDEQVRSKYFLDQKVTDSKNEDVSDARRKSVTPPPPPPAEGDKSTKPRRVESFSSPPPERTTARGKQQGLPTTPRTPENRGIKRGVRGTDPKVVIALDD
ncbi:MAG: hypothetical protein LQ350_001770 [Teloschistes chrysophthalmus]|nr:MAG: hypothetical protein LQ350_001770 [Niorma chrysophthalma]